MIRLRRTTTALIAAGALALTSLGGLVGPATAGPAVVPDPAATITFLVGLRYRADDLQAAAKVVSTPGTTNYRRYLTVKDAARTFGATAIAEQKLVRAAKAAGLVARIDGTRLFARVSGTVAAWQAVMGQPVLFNPAVYGSAQSEDSQPPFNTYVFATADLETYAGPPAALKGDITWFLPIFTQYVPSLDIPGVPPSATTKSSRLLIYPEIGKSQLPVNGGTPIGQTCLSGDLAAHTFTPDQLSQAYGLSALQRQTVKGVQARIAVLSFGGGFAQSDVDTAAACFGYTSPKIDVRLGLGIDTPIVSLSGESALDLQTVGWAAKYAKSVRFIQVTNSETAYIDAYSIALTKWPTPPDAITLSWGDCELANSGGSRETVESLLQFSAVVGTSAFVASGDRGSSVCQTAGIAPADPRPTIGYPASSPYITAVGGTQLNLGAGNQRIGESVWNDLQYGITGNAVGTGGMSVIFDAPWYQRPVTGSDVRSVPDIAAQAGIGPGMTIYYGGTALGPAGGTSQASPLVAAGFALMSAQLRAVGKPAMGFINPWIYRTARFHRDAMYDVTIGDNQYPVQYAAGSINVPACCQAYPGFDSASGLGAPLFDQLTTHMSTAARVAR